jgi:epoxyqueuosine reductase
VTDFVESLTKNIKLKAFELGFSHVGVANAETLINEGKRLLEWLTCGYPATMQWLERDSEKRIDPLKVLKNAKSVICVAMNYYTSDQHSHDRTVGKISRYAWGEDYHIIMNNRMEELLEFIESKNPEAKGKIYVDTGPLMEKAWAVRSGIGWMGKHTNVITRELGSWVFLGEVLLDIELDYDRPIMDYCGTCTACIDACPTHAIIQPYLLDSNKCISYLTIEDHDTLPNDLVPKFQNWIYGCDVCQDVCPWNRFQKETEESAFQPREGNIEPRLNEIAEMSQEEFSGRFKRSPIKRAKHSGLTRNARAILESGKS